MTNESQTETALSYDECISPNSHKMGAMFSRDCNTVVTFVSFPDTGVSDASSNDCCMGNQLSLGVVGSFWHRTMLRQV